MNAPAIKVGVQACAILIMFMPDFGCADHIVMTQPSLSLTQADHNPEPICCRGVSLCADRKQFLNALRDDYVSTRKNGDESSQKVFGAMAGMSWPHLIEFLSCIGQVRRFHDGTLEKEQKARGIKEVVTLALVITTVPVTARAGTSETIDLPVIAIISGTLQADGSIGVKGKYYIDGP